MSVLPQKQVPAAPTNVGIRISRDAALFEAVVLRLHKGDPLETWPAHEREALLLACMPEDDHVEGIGFWRWTVEGDKGNRLLRFLVYLPRQRPFVEWMRAERRAIPLMRQLDLGTAAEMLRARLSRHVKLWCLTCLEDKQ